MLFIVLLLLLQLGASFALADLSSQHELVAADSHRHAPFPRSAAESMSSAATTLNVGASYRPPLIKLKSQGGLVSCILNLHISIFHAVFSSFSNGCT